MDGANTHRQYRHSTYNGSTCILLPVLTVSTFCSLSLSSLALVVVAANNNNTLLVLFITPLCAWQCALSTTFTLLVSPRFDFFLTLSESKRVSVGWLPCLRRVYILCVRASLCTAPLSSPLSSPYYCVFILLFSYCISQTIAVHSESFTTPLWYYIFIGFPKHFTRLYLFTLLSTATHSAFLYSLSLLSLHLV
ncbi:hypothetical protein BDF19DRAFT_405659 [Syncephalis fuscata]|nr:hypothetical protein BDF19DRAFT_405659 [Syncephalis fuscata]